MAKILSAREASLQKKLIPLNIVVVILALVAAFTLIFSPLIKVDVGKILRDDAVMEFVEKELGDNMGDLSSDGEGFNLDVTPIITTAVSKVLSKAKGSITLSTYQFMKYSSDPRENKVEILLDGIVYGDHGIVTELVNSLVDGIGNLFESAEVKEVLQDALIDGMISSMGSIVESIGGEDSELAQILEEKLTEEKVQELKETFLEINNVQSEEDVVEVVDTFIEKINDVLGEDYGISEEDKEAVTEYIVELYKDTMEAIEASGEDIEFSLEAMICVAVANNVDLSEFNINDMLQEMLGNMGNTSSVEHPSTVKKALTEEGGSSTNPPLTYGDLFSQAGLGEEDLEEIKTTVNQLVQNLVTGELDSIDAELRQLGALYENIFLIIVGVLAIFIVPWLILALVALLKIFTKNKRFTMWYVKLLGGFLALIWVALIVVKNVIVTKVPVEQQGLMNAVLGGVSTSTWVCGLCYLLLWAVSIFWAFPIKHKIRKERKKCKRDMRNGMYSYDSYEDDYGYAVSKKDIDDDPYEDDFDDDDNRDYSYEDDE